MSSPVGLTVPKLLPIARTWVAPFAAYNILLSWGIMALRMKTECYVADKIQTPTTRATSLSVSSKGPALNSLETASRCHISFLENVPLAFAFLTICELKGGNRKNLNYTMALLFALRLLMQIID